MRASPFWSFLALSAALAIGSLFVPLTASIALELASITALGGAMATGSKLPDPAPTGNHRSMIHVFSILMHAAWWLLLMLELVSIGIWQEWVGVDEGLARLAAAYPILVVSQLLALSGTLMARRFQRSSLQEAPIRLRWTLFAVMLVPSVVATLMVLLQLYPAGLEPRHLHHAAALGLLAGWPAAMTWFRVPRVDQMIQESLDHARTAPLLMREQMRRKSMYVYLAAFGLMAGGIVLATSFSTGLIGTPNRAMQLATLVVYAIILLSAGTMVIIRARQGRYLRPTKEAMTPWEQEAIDRRTDPDRPQRVLMIMISMGLLLPGFAVSLLARLGALGSAWLIDGLVIALLGAGMPWLYWMRRQSNRERAWDDHWPDVLRDVAEMAKSGMTLPRALASAASGARGALKDSLHHLSVMVQWGVPFLDALERFQLRAPSKLIKRSTALIREAERSGGSVAEVLLAASDDARRIQKLERQRLEQMRPYGLVISIAFAVFIVVALVLVLQFLPAFAEAQAATEGAEAAGFLGTEVSMERITSTLYHASVLQAIASGFVSGVLVYGRARMGLTSGWVMTVIAFVSFHLPGVNLI